MPKAVGYDADAQAFITATGITDLTQKNAINQLVLDLKGYSIWTKMKALYPFVGGTATTHKFNLKNPLDTDAAFRLVFNGGWTHSSTGALSNGTNAYANSFFAPSVNQNVNSNGFGCYITQNTSADPDPIVMGSFTGTGQASLLVVKSTTMNTRLNSVTISSTISGGAGSFDAQKTDATTTSLYKNGSFLTSGNSGGLLTPYTEYIGSLNLANGSYGFVSCYFRLAYFSEGLSSTEIGNLRTAVQTFQTSLSRQI